MASEVSVTVLDRQRGYRVDRSSLQAFLRKAVSELPPPGSGELAVCLISDRKMRDLNRRFRDRDATTDVLSFPGGAPEAGEACPAIGDIAISVPAAVRQARAMKHSLARELNILVLHGYLHLLGYDHERDRGEMMRLQRRLLHSLLGPGKGGSSRRRR